MITIKNLSIKKISDNRFLLKNFNLIINYGDKIAIIGEEGDGKSTLLKVIAKDKLVYDYCDIEGSITNIKKIGYLPQFMDERWDNYTVSDFFLKSSPEEEIDYNRFQFLNNKTKMTELFDLPNDIFYSDQEIRTLSGGERVKILMLKILLSEPDILLLDEPTNDLDFETVEIIEKIIKEQSIPVVFVSHDEMLINNCANQIIHLEQIKNKLDLRHTIYIGDYKSYLEERYSKIEKQSKIAKFQKKEYEESKKVIREMKSQAASNTAYSTKRIKQLMAVERRLEKSKENNLEIPDVEEAIKIFASEKITIPNSKEILDFSQDLEVGGKIKYKDYKLKIVGPEKVAIIGKNGAGKTTLLKKIYKELSSRTDITVGYMPQNYDEKIEAYESATDFLMQTCTNETLTSAKTFLGCLKFKNEEMDCDIKQLSGGQKAKLLIASFIIKKCNVLLLDEPTRNLSPLSTSVITNLLKNYNGALIVVSHDRKFINDTCNRIVLLEKKKIGNKNENI